MRSDRDLLDAYLGSGSHDAFSEIVNRYSSMVYGACMRVLGDPHAAEDASQAVFLILMKKAGSLRTSPNLAGWLFRTAGRAAKNARKIGARRKVHERKAGTQMSTVAPPEQDSRNEIRARLDAAIAALPRSQREVVIRRYLAGEDRKAIAKSLDCPEATVQSRLNRAIERLRSRFTKEGITVSAVALSALLSEQAASAAPPSLAPAIRASCLGSAEISLETLGIMEVVMKSMMWSRVQMFGACAAALLTVAIALPSLLAGDEPTPKKNDVVSASAEKVSKPKGFFPMGTGYKWTYGETETGLKGATKAYDVTFQSTDQGEKEGARTYRVNIDYPNKDAIEIDYRISKTGVELTHKKETLNGKAKTHSIADGNWFLKFPLKKGTTWSYGKWNATVLDEEKIKVPAGTFTCQHIQFKTRPQVVGPGPRPLCNAIGIGDAIKIDIWIADGTGIVKQSWNTGGSVPIGWVGPSYSRELKKFENDAKPIPIENSESYFPMDDGYRWTYREQTRQGRPEWPWREVLFQAKHLDAHQFDVDVRYWKKDTMALRYKIAPSEVLLTSKSETVGGRTKRYAMKEAETFLKLPLQDGKEWTYGIWTASVGKKTQVKVPAGTYDCLVVQLRKTSEARRTKPDKVRRAVCNAIGISDSSSVTIYLAKGVGIVYQKWYVKDSQWPVVRELVKFEKNRK